MIIRASAKGGELGAGEEKATGVEEDSEAVKREDEEEGADHPPFLRHRGPGNRLRAMAATASI